VEAEEIAVVALLALALMGELTPAPSPSPSLAGARPKIKSWTGTAQAWTQSRYKVALDILDSKLPPDLDAEEMAKSVVAHWGIETNWGANEFNYNLGGIHASAGQTYFASTDAGVPTRFVAYGSVEDGANGYASLLLAKYQKCVKLLASSPETADWYVCLGSMGYYGKNPNAASLFTGARAKVVSYLGGSS
jgi:hypothetical protein